MGDSKAIDEVGLHVLWWLVEDCIIVDWNIEHANLCLKDYGKYDAPNCAVWYAIEEGEGLAAFEEYINEASKKDGEYKQPFNFHFTGGYDYWGEYDCDYEWKPVGKPTVVPLHE